MRTGIPIILSVAFAGMAMGAGLRWVSGLGNGRALDNTTPGTDSMAWTVPTTVAPSTADVLPGPRPRLDDLFAATGAELPALMVRYLREATIDEVIGLLESVEDRGRQLYEFSWLIYRRGVLVNPQRLVKWAEQYPNRPILRMVFQSWGEIDPEAALAASQGHGKEIREALIRGVAESDLDRAIAVLERGEQDSRLLPQLRRRRLAELAETSPKAALEEATALPGKAERDAAIVFVTKAWSDKDPFGALAWIEDHDELPNKVLVYENALRAVAKKDPMAALRKLETLTHARERHRIEGNLVEIWSQQDPESALDWIRELPASSRRDHLFGSISQNLETSPEELLGLLSELQIDPSRAGDILGLDIDTEGHGWGFGGGGSLGRQTREALTELAKEAPMEALIAMSDISLSADAQSDYVQGITEAWAARNASEAASWTASLPEATLTQKLRGLAIKQWGDEEPAEAARFLQEHDLILPDSRIAIDLVEKWAVGEPEAAFMWANGLSADSRSEVVTKALEVTAQHDPPIAVEHLSRLPTTEQPGGVDAIASAWRKNDPRAAFDWLYTQYGEMNHGSTLQETAKSWVLARPREASEWIAGLESGPARDRAVAGMVNALISTENPNRDFEAAQAWVSTIADEELRTDWGRRMIEVQAKGLESSGAGAGGGSFGGAVGGFLHVETPSITSGQ